MRPPSGISAVLALALVGNSRAGNVSLRREPSFKREINNREIIGDKEGGNDTAPREIRSLKGSAVPSIRDRDYGMDAARVEEELGTGVFSTFAASVASYMMASPEIKTANTYALSGIPCLHEGGEYAAGEYFHDGCNSCFCGSAGRALCTRMACIDPEDNEPMFFDAPCTGNHLC